MLEFRKLYKACLRGWGGIARFEGALESEAFASFFFFKRLLLTVFFSWEIVQVGKQCQKAGALLQGGSYVGGCADALGGASHYLVLEAGSKARCRLE